MKQRNTGAALRRGFKKYVKYVSVKDKDFPKCWHLFNDFYSEYKRLVKESWNRPKYEKVKCGIH